MATAPTLTANGSQGSYVVVATVTTGSGSATANFSLTNALPGTPLINVAAGSGQTSGVNTAFTTLLSARVLDAGGTPLSGVQVQFAAPQTGVSGLFARTSSYSDIATTDATGVAVASRLSANQVAGGYQVTASAAGASQQAVFSLTNTAAAPATIEISAGNGQSTLLGTAFPIPLAATVKDAFGNLVNQVSVTFSAPASGASGAFANGQSSATASTNSGGVATVSLSANQTAGSYQVSATVVGVSGAATFNVTNSNGCNLWLYVTSSPVATDFQVTVDNQVTPGYLTNSFLYTNFCPGKAYTLGMSPSASDGAGGVYVFASWQDTGGTSPNRTVIIPGPGGGYNTIYALDSWSPMTTTISTGTLTRQALRFITADSGFTISGSAAVVFKAGTSIHLGNGFRATAGKAGTTFHALIGPPTP